MNPILEYKDVLTNTGFTTMILSGMKAEKDSLNQISIKLFKGAFLFYTSCSIILLPRDNKVESERSTIYQTNPSQVLIVVYRFFVYVMTNCSRSSYIQER